MIQHVWINDKIDSVKECPDTEWKSDADDFQRKQKVEWNRVASERNLIFWMAPPQ